MKIKYNPSKTLGPQSAHLVETLHERRHTLFALPEVMEITGLRPPSARSFMRALVQRGVAARLRSGLYNLVPFELGKERDYLGNPYVVARELLRGHDYYLSHASAMDIHGMTTQPQLVVYATTTKLARKRTILGTEFRFVRCPASRFFGFTEHWATKEEKVLVSDIERTVLDGVRIPKYCGGITEVAKGFWMRRAAIDVKKLVDYALQLDFGSALGRLGYLMEILEIGSKSDRESLRWKIGTAYVPLDPVLPREGKFLARWRLRLNVSADEIRSILHT